MADPTPKIVDNVFETPRPCGPCSFCCFLYPMRSLDKPEHSWCQHFAKGVGCSIHATRPSECSDFQCLWTYAAPLDDRWRPDQCRFVMRPGPSNEVVIDVDPKDPGAWKREPFYSQIKTWSVRRLPPHRMVIVRAGGRMAVVFPEGEVDLGPEQANEPIESGYVLRNGQQQPYAHYGPAGSPPKPAEPS
jgi:hypothetical protein